MILHIDHLKPKSKGGENDPLNLITSCADCNLGKSNRELSDNQVLEQKRRQLELLQERKEQLEMMFDWQKELLNLDEQTISGLSDYWTSCVPGYYLTDVGARELKKLLRQFAPEEIMAAMRTAAAQYLEYENEKASADTAKRAFRMIGGVCRNNRLKQKNPELARVYYIRGILRNRLFYSNDVVALQLLKRALEMGAVIEQLEEHAKNVRNWSQWRSDYREIYL